MVVPVGEKTHEYLRIPKATTITPSSNQTPCHPSPSDLSISLNHPQQHSEQPLGPIGSVWRLTGMLLGLRRSLTMSRTGLPGRKICLREIERQIERLAWWPRGF